MQKVDQKIGASINLIKLPQNNTFEFDFDQSTDWVKDILIEMNEKASEKTPEDYLSETHLSIQGELVKKQKPEMGEYLLLKLDVQATYATECVRTLQPMTQDLDFVANICFVDEEMAKTELFEDSDETWVENQTWELYFYKNRNIELRDVIHEQIFINYEQYPILDAESPLLISEEEAN